MKRFLVFALLFVAFATFCTSEAAVAKIGTTEYETLKAAFEAVPPDGTQTVITLTDDLSTTTTLGTLKAGGNAVLDLNGHKISGSLGSTSVGLIQSAGTLVLRDTGGTGAITVQAKGLAVKGTSATAKIYLENGTISATGASAKAVQMASTGLFQMDGGSITSESEAISASNAIIHDGSVRAKSYVLSGGGVVSGGDLSSSTSAAIYSTAALTIEGGTISGADAASAIRIYSGTVTVPASAALYPSANKVSFTANASAIVKTTDSSLAPTADLALYDGETLVGFCSSASTATTIKDMAGTTVKLLKDITTTTGWSIQGNDVTVDLNGHKISSSGLYALKVKGSSASSKRAVTITGEGSVSCNNGGGCVAVYVDQWADVSLSGGSYSVGGDADNTCIYIGASKSTAPSTVTITDGRYETGDGRFVLNMKDDARTTGGATISVTGGQFKGFDPANNAAEGPETSFLGEGVISAPTEEGWFEVRDYAWVTIPEVEHASATVTVNGAEVAIKDGKIPAPIGSKVVVKYAADAEWANTKSVTIAKVTEDTTVDVGTYKPVPANVKVTAADGTVSYKTFSTTLLSSPADGAIYELLADVTTTRFTFGSALTRNKTATLDLGGHTLTCTTTGSTADLLFHSSMTGSALTVRNGTFKAAGDAFSISKGNTLVLDETLTVEAAQTCVKVVGAGTTLETAANLTSAGSFAIAGNGSAGNGGTTIKVTGGSVTAEGNAPAIYHPQAGTLEISGGTITGATAVYVKSGDVTVTGGTLVATGAGRDYAYTASGVVATGDALVIENCNYPGGAPTVQVTGGRFESANGEAIASYAGSSDGADPEPVVGFVSGEEGSYPTFNKGLAEELCAPGFMPDDDGIGNYSITKLPAVCEVEGVGYWSLQLAAEAAAKSGNPIELIDDVYLTEQVLVEGAVTLDLKGHTIAYAGEKTLTSGVIAVKRGGNLTIEDSVGDGLIDAGTKAYAAVALTVKGEPAEGETAALTLNGGTLQGYYYGIVGNGSRHGTAITINDGVVTGTCPKDNQGIYHPQDGTLTITGGTITGYSSAVEMRAGSLVMTGGRLEATADHVATNPNGSGSTSVGSALAIAQHTTKKPIDVKISGGELAGFAAVYESNPNKTDATDRISISITGGTFTAANGGTVSVYSEDCTGFISGGSFSNRVPDAYCDEDFDATDKLENGQYGVTPKKTVAKIGTREFWSIDRAVLAAEEGDVIELVADYTGPGFTVGEGKDVVFSTGAFTYTATSPVTVQGHLCIADESTVDFRPTAPEGAELFATEGEAAKVDISAGSFNVPLQPAWCDEAYEPVELEGGRFGVQEKKPVCTINGKGYWSVGAALRAAEPFDTIVLIEDLIGEEPLLLDRGHVTLDLNGHVISSVLVSGAVVTVQDSQRTGYIGGEDVATAITIEAGKLYVESGKVIAKDKAIAIEQDAAGELIAVEISGGTFTAPTVLHQENVNKLPSTALDQISISITDGVFTGTVYAEDKRAFITGGQFDPPPEKKYKRDDIKAELPSVTVTTELDVVNPYDFKISLREALLYAEADAHNGISEEGGYKITFNWDAIKADAAARGVEATGIFDLSAAPFEATADLYDETTGRSKFILIDGSLDAGEDNLMGEGDRMAVIRGLDFLTLDTKAPVRAVVVEQDPESVIRLVDRLEARDGEGSGAEGEQNSGEHDDEVSITAPDDDVIDDSGEGVCELDGELYTSVRQALAAVPADGQQRTLKLVDDFTGLAFSLKPGQNVVLDLGGHRYEVTNGGFAVQPEATLVLKNGSIRSNTAATLITNAGTLTLEDLDLDLSERPAVTALLKVMSGSTVMTGSTAMAGRIVYEKADRVEFRGTGDYAVTFDAPLTANIRIYSGRFADPDTVPVEFQAVPLDGFYWQITDAEGAVTKFATLADAYATVPGDGTPVTITQLFDQEGRGLVIDGNKNVTIDFNGKTYTVVGANANANFIINGKREVVTLRNGTLRTTTPGNLISNMGRLTLADMNIDLRTSELNPGFRNIVSSTYGETIVTGDTRLAVPAEFAALAVTAQRNDDWAYDKVQVTFDKDFTGQVIGAVRYGESTGATKDASWLDAARIDVDGGEFDVRLVDTTPLVEKAVENIRLHGGTFTRTSEIGTRPIGDFAYTEVDIDWEVRARYVHFERCSFDLIGRDVRMLVDRCWFEGNSVRRPDWILESDSTGKTSIQFLNSVIHQAKGAIFVNEISRGTAARDGYVLVGDSTIGETTGGAAILVNNANVETYLVNATFYGNAGKTVDTVGATRAVNVLSQKNGENLPSKNIEVMTSIYQEEYADAEIFRMDAEDPAKPHFGFRWLRAGTPVDEASQDGAWSLTPAYHLNDESVAGGNCRYVKLAMDNDGYVEVVRTALKQNGTYTVFAGDESSEAPLHTLYYDQTLANLDRGQPSKGAFWIPVDEPSLVVTTIRDTVNPTDLEISLREAINYAKYLATEDQTTISTITFDWDALDEELAALRAHGVVGTGDGKLDDFAMYLGWSIDWDRRSNTGDCHLVPGKSAAKPISITAEELPQGLVINANRNGSVRPYFTVNGSLWGDVDAPVAFDLGDGAKLKSDHFRVTAVNGTGYRLGKNANLYLVNSSAADNCVDGIVGDEGSTVVLERSSVACNGRVGVSATNVSAQNTAIGGGTAGLSAQAAQLFNTTVVGGVRATTLAGVNDIVSGPVAAETSWFRYSAFDSVGAGDTNITHNVATDNLQLTPAQSSLLWHYRFPSALDWGRYGTAVATSKGYDWSVNGAPLPTYVWGQRTSKGQALEVETAKDRVAQALPDTWAAYAVGSDTPYSDEMKGAILNDVITNTRNPHEGQLSMGAWQANTIVAWKTLATSGLTTTDHATDFSRIDLNTYYETLQDAVDALAQNAAKGEQNVKFEGKDAVFLVSATLANSALGDDLQTVISKGDVAIVGNSYYYSGIKATERDVALIVENGCSVAIANVGFVESTGTAIEKRGTGDVTLYRSAVNGNGGDGIAFAEGATGNLLMFNTTVANNKGTGVRLQDGTAQIYDSTVVGNNQGLAGSGEFYLANSVILKNTNGNEDHVKVKGGAYNVMTATGLTDAQIADVFYNNSLATWYRMVRVNYIGAAGWMGTKVGRDKDGNWYYLDRGDPMADDVPVADWTWKSVKTGAVAAQPSEVIVADQQGTSRLLAEYAGFHEYAVGAYVPEMELEVEVMDQSYPYNGKAQNPDPSRAIYRIRTGIGKLNQGHDLYYNAADKTFYSEFAYVTNRVVDALGVAPAPWGEPTVSKPRTDLGDFTFSADILPVQAGDKINVLRRMVPGAAMKDGFSVDADGYAYLDGYPFIVTDVRLTKGGRDLTGDYEVLYPQTETRDYAKMYITPKAISLSRAFSQTKEYDGTKDVVITSESLEHAGVLFGEVVIAPGSKFEYGGADVLPNYGDNINPDGSVKPNANTSLTAEDLGFVGSTTAMGNYYITSESQNYTSIIVPKKIRVSLADIAKKLYDGEETEITFDFTDERLVYTASNAAQTVTHSLAEALVLPTRYIEGRLTVCQTNVIDGVVHTNATQIFAKDVADYPFFVICEELNVYDTEDKFDEKGDRKTFTKNYAFDFSTCESVYTVEKKPVTLAIAVDDRVYTGSAFVEPDTAVSHEPISTGIKDEAFSIMALGAGNARYESAHVKGDEAVQTISLIDAKNVVYEGVNGAVASNYSITFAPTGRILRRTLEIERIKGVETKLYDGSMRVRVDTDDTASYVYAAAEGDAGLVAGEFVKLSGTGRVENMGVGATHQKVAWENLAILDDTGRANDYALAPFESAAEDVSVRIEPCDLQLVFSTSRVYDNTLEVRDLALTVTTTNAAGKVRTLVVAPVAAAEGMAWSFQLKTGIVNERTEQEEILYFDIPSATLTSGEVNTYAGNPRDVLVVSEIRLRAESETGAVLANYRAFAGTRNVATEHDLVGTARIDRRPITFQAENRTMTYGGMKPDLTLEGSYVLLDANDLAVGDQIAQVRLAFDVNNIRQSRSGQFQKGYYERGIVRGDVQIVGADGTTSRNRNYTITVRPGALQVGPGTLTMVLDPTPFVKDYDGTTAAEENYEAITLKGLIENNLTGEIDDVTVTGVFTYDTKDVVVGADGSFTNKTITFVRTAIGGKDAANYDWAKDEDGNVIVEVSAFGATINPRPATVNVSAADKDYDATTVATPTTVAFDNLVAGEAFDFDRTGITAAFADRHRGVGKPVVVSLNGELLPRIKAANDLAILGNYAFAFDPNTTATIRGIPLTVTAKAQSMVYGDANPDLNASRVADAAAQWSATDLAAGDAVTVELKYAEDLAKSTSGNFTVQTHEQAIVKESIVVKNGEEDVTDSYDITYVPADLAVAPRVLEVSVEGDGVVKVYDGTTDVVPEQQNHALDNTIEKDVVDVTGVFAYNSKDVATATTIIFSNLALTGADAANYTLDDVTEVSDTGAKITPFETTVTIAANGKTYDGDRRATAKGAVFAPLVGNEKFTFDVAQISGVFDDRHAAADKPVTWADYADDLIAAVDASGAIKSNYAFVHALSAVATIEPKPATITFAAKSRQYDATTDAARTADPFVFDGLVAPNEEGVAEAFILNDESMTYAFDSKNVGEGKTVTATGYQVSFIASASEGGASVPGDYTFTFANTAKADITKKPMTISYTTKDKVYDATPDATRDTFTYDGLCANDKVTLDDGAMTYVFMDVDGQGTGKNVGENKVVRTPDHDFETNGKMSGADVGNYSYTFTPESQATIFRKPVTLVLPLVEKTYDGTTTYDPAVTKTVPEMAGTEVFAATAYGAFTDKVHNETVMDYFQATELTIAATDGADFGNYSLTYAKDRTIELEAGTMSFTMPADAPFLTDGRINRRSITITANDQAMIYGEDNPELNTAASGGTDCDWSITTGEKVAADTITTMLAYGTIPTSTSGNYKATEGGADHANAVVKASVVIVDDQNPARDVTDSYAITFVNGKLAVAKRQIELTVDGTKFEKVYDGARTTEAADRNYTFCAFEKGAGCGPVTGDLLDASGTYMYNSKDVKEAKTVTFSGITLTKADAANYKLKVAEVVSSTGAKITPRETVITVKPENKVYDGTPITRAKIESFSNLVSGESFSLDKTELQAIFAQSDVGTAIEVTYVGYKESQVSAGADTRLDNYTFTFTNKAVGNITKRPSTITWQANSKQYDAKVAATVTSGSFAFGNLVDGEGFTMNEAGFTYAFADKNVGTAKPVTATPNETLEAQIASNGGAAKVSNYAFTLTKTAPADITPAPLTITFTTKDKTYDATPKATRDAFQYAPLLVDDQGVTDDVTLDDSRMEYAFVDVGDVADTGKNAAENKRVKTVDGKGYDESYLRGKDKDNYEVAFTDESTATINKMELRLDLPKADKVYDATTALREETLVKTVQGAGDETFTATALGEYKDTHANDYDTYVTVTDLTIAGANGAVFGNYVIRYAGHGTEAVREQTETGTYDNALFQTTASFGTPGRITALGFTVAAINQTMIYGDSYPVINGTDVAWGEGKVWSLPGTQLATGDRIWVTLKWSESIPTSSAGYYTAGTHTGALSVDAITILRSDDVDVTKSYAPTFQSARLTVDKRVLTVTVDGSNFEKVYDGNRTTEEGDRTYSVDEAIVDKGKGKFAADVVTVEGVYTYNDKDVEEANTVTFSEQTLKGTDAANYTLDGVASVVSSDGAKITRRPCDITVTTTGKTYDGNVTANPIATYAFSNLVAKNESDVKEDFTLTIDAFTGSFDSKDVETASTVTFTHAGVVKDHLTGADATSLLSNYDFTFKPEAEAKIAPRHVSVTWRVEDKDYDQNTDAKPVLGSFVFATPVVNMHETQESFTVSDENARGMVYTFSDKNVGVDKTVTATGWTCERVTEGDDTLASNYIFDFVPTAKAEIRPITLTIGYTADDKVYDATTNATRTADFTYTGLINGDVFTLDDAKMYYGFDTKNVGVDKTVTAYGFDPVYLQGADVANYTVAFTTNTTAAITKKNLTLTLSEAKKVYDGTTTYEPTIGQVIPDTEGGEVFTATATGVFNTKLAGSSDTYFHVTELDIVGTEGADFGNYKIKYNGGEIDAADLETIQRTITEAFDTKGAITPAEVTVTARNRAMTYGDAVYPALAQDVSCEVTGLLPTDALTATFTWKTFAESDYSSSHNLKAGHYAEAVVVGAVTIDNGGENATASYVVKTVNGAFTVNPKPVTVVLDGGEFTKTYDGTVETVQKEYQFAANDVVEGDAVTATGSFAYDEKDASTTRVVTMSEIKLGESDDSVNYVLANADAKAVSEATAVIEKKPVAVAAQANDKIYDKTAAATSQMVTFDGLVTGESLVYPTTLNGTFADVNVGTGITVTWNDFDWEKVSEAAVKANYEPTVQPSSAAITPKDVTVRAKAQEMTYAERRPSLAEADDWSVEDLENGDALVVTLGWNETNIAKSGSGHPMVGTHAAAVALVSAVNDNYTVTFVSAALTVTEDADKELRIGWKNEHLPITVSTVWLDAHVPEFAYWAEADGHEKTSDGLLALGTNGYPLWQSYLLGLDPAKVDAKLWIDGMQTADADKLHVLYHDVADRPTDAAGYAVHFRLDTLLKGTASPVSSLYQSSAEFDIALDHENPTGRYAIQCVFTKKGVASDVVAANLVQGTDVASEGLRTVNELGLLKVEAVNANSILSVPWVTPSPIVGEDRPIAVSNLVKAANLDADAAVHVYDLSNVRYESWRREAMDWSPLLMVDAEGVRPSERAVLRRGQGFWVVRRDLSKPVYLFGQVPTTSVEMPIAKGGPATANEGIAHLVGSPLLAPFDFSTIRAGVDPADQIFVPQADGHLRLYTYQADSWGYTAYVTNRIGNRVSVKAVRKTDENRVPTGQGFWYTSHGGSPVLTWSAPSDGEGK